MSASTTSRTEPGDVARLVAQVHADESRDLVVAAAARAQAAAQVLPGALHEPALQSRVNIFVSRSRSEDAGDDILLETVQSPDHAVQLSIVEQTRTAQGPSVGTRTGDVIAGEAPVEVGGDGQRRQRIGRPTGEASAPQADPGSGTGGLVLVLLTSHGPIMTHRRAGRRTLFRCSRTILGAPPHRMPLADVPSPCGEHGQEAIPSYSACSGHALLERPGIIVLALDDLVQSEPGAQGAHGDPVAFGQQTRLRHGLHDHGGHEQGGQEH